MMFPVLVNRSIVISSLLLVMVASGGPYACANGKKNAPTAPTFNKEAFIASAEDHEVLSLGLADCIAEAFKENSEVKIKRIDPKLRADDVKIAWSEFEPSLYGGYSLRENMEKSSNLFFQGMMKERDINADAGIKGKLPTGTKYDIGLDFERYSSNSIIQTYNPAYTAEPVAIITQPILRGFGIAVNEANISISRNNKSMSDLDFKRTVMDIVTRTKNVYYLYFYTEESHSIAKLALERATSLLDINNARYKKGLVSSVDVLETEAAVADREKSLIASEKALQKAEDDLKFVTNIVDDPDKWNVKVELIDRPGLDTREVDLIEALVAAFDNRPDYKAAGIDLKNKDINVMVTKNGLLPIVDLIGSYGLNGLDSNYRGAFTKIDGDYRTWVAGAQVTIPFGSGDRAKFDQAKLQKVQALIGYKRLEQSIILEVRDKVRNVEIQFRVVKAAELALKKEKENYAAQQERYAAGQVSTHDMLDYQDKLSRAELDHARALIDYNIILCELDRVQGLTLEKNGIQLEE
jgi:outer membrane protein